MLIYDKILHLPCFYPQICNDKCCELIKIAFTFVMMIKRQNQQELEKHSNLQVEQYL